jgi:hypothetical protein
MRDHPPGALDRRGRDRLTLGWLGFDRLVRGLSLFWALYFAVVTLSNLTDLLRHLGALSPRWGWVSGNLAFIASSIARVGVPASLAAPLLAGVILWETLCALLFARATARPDDPTRLGPAFSVSLALWATFVLLDEALIIYETGAEATHLRLFTAELATLAVIRVVGSARAAP